MSAVENNTSSVFLDDRNTLVEHLLNGISSFGVMNENFHFSDFLQPLN